MVNQGVNNNMFNSFMANPLQFLLMKQNIQVPQEYAYNPQAAVQYLMNTGRMSQATFETIKQRAAQMGINI